MTHFDPDALAAWSGGDWRGGTSVVSGVSVDSRTLSPGAMFVALAGPRFDGHAFVPDAFASGAVAALVTRREPGWPDGWPLLLAPDTGAALGGLARGYRRKVAPRIIGITGSAGKTTVKTLLAALLASEGPVGATQGNWNNAVGLPLSLLGMDPAARWGVFELGTSAPGEIAALCDVLEPDWGIVTAVGAAHLEQLRSLDGVAEEKAALPRCLPTHGVFVLDADGAYSGKLRAETAAEVVTVSLGGQADYSGEPLSGARLRVFEQASGDTAILPQAWPGRHQSLNLLLAVAAARRAGVAWESMVETLRRPCRLPMRWETLVQDGVSYINDAYNANPLSMRAALSCFMEMDISGGRWLVLGDMLELGRGGPEAHRELGAWLAGHAWAGVVTVGELGARIAEGAGQAGYPEASITVRCDVTGAADWLRARLAPGDAVLLKGSRSMGLERVVEMLRTCASEGGKP